MAYLSRLVLAYYQTDLASAEPLFEEALALFRQAGDQEGMSRALRNLAVVLGDQGKFARARSYAEESLMLARGVGDVQNLANALSDLGVLHYYLGECNRALPYLEESLALDRRRGESSDVAIRLHNLAEVLGSMGRHTEARQLHEESMVLFRQVENQYGVAFSLQAQGDQFCAQGDFRQAQNRLGGVSLCFGNWGTPRAWPLACSALPCSPSSGSKRNRRRACWGHWIG